MAHGEADGAHLNWRPIAILVVLALTWGGNMALIKLAGREVAPLFMAGLRSAVAAFCLWIWMRAKGLPAFGDRRLVGHGAVAGLLFGLEFGLMYVGLGHTLASRSYVLVYSAPFWVALGAHFWLAGDRLHPGKLVGLSLAFAGVLVLFGGSLGEASADTLMGDCMALAAGALWGATTLYVKRFLAQDCHPLQNLFWQLFFSAPLLFGLSLFLEPTLVHGLTGLGVFSIFYQCIIVAFLSYLVWFHLIHRYPVSLLHAFSFITPLCGVFISGLLIMGEGLTLNLVISLVLVCLGLILVNRAPRHKMTI